MTNYLDIHFGDEIIIGPLKGVRFWTYEFPSRTITSFQYHDIVWSPWQPAVSDGIPTVENGRGLNVYKTEADAMHGSADAINGVVKDIGAHAVGGWSWITNRSGILLGEVEFWGDSVIEHEFGYRAQYVKPTRFLRAWGYQPEQTVDELNKLWFGT
jgi:hypothetical protein